MSQTTDLAIELISRPSLTPDDFGCQDLLARRLQTIGFKIERGLKKSIIYGRRYERQCCRNDKEGPATNGTIKVIEHLEQQNIKIDFCIAGKPSSRVRLYDTIKNGRRGSLNGYLTIHCVQETHRLSPTGKHLLGACPRIDILIKIEVL